MNRFKGLDLVMSVPEKLWTEVCNIVQEVANKTIPKKKKSKKAKWLSEEALQIAEEQREVKSKEEREKYIQLKAGFQRIARRDKKVYFNDQCLIIEENNKRKDYKSLQENWKHQRSIHPKMGKIKDKNSRDLVDL